MRGVSGSILLLWRVSLTMESCLESQGSDIY